MSISTAVQYFEVLSEGEKYEFIFDTGGYILSSEEPIETFSGI
jgi:hypothetical protein